MKEIRLLKADEIELRVSTIKENGCSLLLYKDARVDMRILDESFGVTGWQRTHEVINGNLFCNISIWDDEKKMWVIKQDVGVESYTEKEKGQASDSFKRAGFNIGIGRELYTSPFVWINLNKDETYDKNGKFYLNPRIKFAVKKIEYNDQREIKSLIIIDNKGHVRFEFGDSVTEEQMKRYTELTAQLGENLNHEELKAYIKKEFEANNVVNLTRNQMETVIKVLEVKIKKLKVK